LRDAASAVRQGGELFGTSRDPTLPMPDGPWPGTGAILAAIETASGRTAEIVGKPAARLIETALDRLGEGRTLVVGDRLDSDIAAAEAAGLDGALVLSGGHTGPTGGEDAPTPVAVADDLRTLVLGEEA
jgi:glycerol 3-phosphatase-2